MRKYANALQRYYIFLEFAISVLHFRQFLHITHYFDYASGEGELNYELRIMNYESRVFLIMNYENRDNYELT